MELYNLRQLRILRYLQKEGFKPYPVIEAEGSKYYEDKIQFQKVFRDLLNLNYVERNLGEVIENSVADDDLRIHPFGISQDGKLRLYELLHEESQDAKQKRYNRWVLILAAIAAVTGLIALFR